MLNSLSTYSQEGNEKLGYSIKEQKYQVSIYTIAGNQGEFDKKPVFLSGYLKFEYEGLNIYPDKCSCKDSFKENSISISITTMQYKSYSNKNKDCEIKNVFGTYNRLNIYSKDNFENLSLGHLDGEIKIYEW